jgi:glycine/D-amino acid oxidase-like deaminating enzyme
MPRPRLIVAGGGMHALEGLDRGYKVIQLERDLSPRGASVRNFGLIWVSGRASGPELDLALDARDRWEKIAAEVPGMGFRPIGGAGATGVLQSVADLPWLLESSPN